VHARDAEWLQRSANPKYKLVHSATKPGQLVRPSPGKNDLARALRYSSPCAGGRDTAI